MLSLQKSCRQGHAHITIASSKTHARSFRCAQQFVIALALVLASALNASPTTFAKISLQQLVTAAPLIARARCQGNLVNSERGEIWTITSFEIREVWKGSAPAVVRVRLLGGRTAELTSHVEGVPRFHPGEDVVLFLEPSRSRGNYSVTGWAQGTFRIHSTGPGAPSVVTQDTAAFLPAEFAGGLAARGAKNDAVRGADGNVVRSAESDAVQGMPLEEFRRQVAAALGQISESR
jgi:hypothetical protein